MVRQTQTIETEFIRFAPATVGPMLESCRSNAPGERQLS